MDAQHEQLDEELQGHRNQVVIEGLCRPWGRPPQRETPVCRQLDAGLADGNRT